MCRGSCSSLKRWTIQNGWSSGSPVSRITPACSPSLPSTYQHLPPVFRAIGPIANGEASPNPRRQHQSRACLRWARSSRDSLLEVGRRQTRIADVASSIDVSFDSVDPPRASTHPKTQSCSMSQPAEPLSHGSQATPPVALDCSHAAFLSQS